MSSYITRAAEGFAGAEGSFSSALNTSVAPHPFDPKVTFPHLIRGLQGQAQALSQMARAIGEMDEKLNAIKRKLGI